MQRNPPRFEFSQNRAYIDAKSMPKTLGRAKAHAPEGQVSHTAEAVLLRRPVQLPRANRVRRIAAALSQLLGAGRRRGQEVVAVILLVEQGVVGEQGVVAIVRRDEPDMVVMMVVLGDVGRRADGGMVGVVI